MDILEKLLDKLKNSDDRQREEIIYREVLLEIQNGVRRDGIWVKALVDGEGDKNKVEALYIKYRAKSLHDEIKKYNSRGERKKRELLRKEEERRREEELKREEERRREEVSKSEVISPSQNVGFIKGTFIISLGIIVVFLAIKPPTNQLNSYNEKHTLDDEKYTSDKIIMPIIYSDGSTYNGKTKDGLRDGRGVYRQYPNEETCPGCTEKEGFTTYDGEWMNDKLNGRITITEPDGTVRIGQYKNGKLINWEAIKFPLSKSFDFYSEE